MARVTAESKDFCDCLGAGAPLVVTANLRALCESFYNSWNYSGISGKRFKMHTLPPYFFF